MTAAACGVLVAAMVGAAYAAVPLYNWFCRTTGFGGTTQVAAAGPSHVLDRKLKVRFDANVAPATGTAALGYFKPLNGYANSINAAANVPGSSPPVVCYANCDGSTANPLLTANAFQCFINAFSLGQSYANCAPTPSNPPPTSNDFTCFINAYAQGCS